MTSTKHRFHATPLLREEARLSCQAGRLHLRTVDHIHIVVRIAEKRSVAVVKMLELEVGQETRALAAIATVEANLDLRRRVRVCVQAGRTTYERERLVVDRRDEVWRWRVRGRGTCGIMRETHAWRLDREEGQTW